MIRFIKANHLDDEIRAHNWAAFARGYNGAAYAKNAYDKKLAAAFAKWARIPDTPSPSVPAPSPAPAHEPSPSVMVEQAKGFWARLFAALAHAFKRK